jgi:hypothetical protein
MDVQLLTTGVNAGSVPGTSSRPSPVGRARTVLAVAVPLIMVAGLVLAWQGLPFTDDSDVVAAGGLAMADAPVLLSDRSGWSVAASTYFDQEIPERAIDGDTATRWATGRYQADDNMWFEIDLGEVSAVHRIELEVSAIWARDFPRGYEVRLAGPEGDFGPVVVREDAVADTFPRTVIELDGESAQRIRINQIGTADANWWSIAEIHVYG